MQKYPMTPLGEQALRQELDTRIKTNRQRIIQAIAEAREHGDLKENAEYHAAREEQSLNEARIRNIEAKLSTAQVIDVTKMTPTDKVIFGTTVSITKCEDNSNMIFQIVGEDEADLKNKKLSLSSPIARSVMGKEVGDFVIVITPSGEQEFEIIKVEYK